MPEKYIRLVQDMYQGCKTVVQSAAGESNSFGVEVGVRKDVPGSMMFADDIALCGDDETDMTKYLETWRNALEKRGISRPKTQFMDFNLGMIMVKKESGLRS